MSIDTLWQSREPIGGDAPSARPQTKFEDYHADIVASLHKKGNTLQIRCTSQNQGDALDPGVNPLTKNKKIDKNLVDSAGFLYLTRI